MVQLKAVLLSAAALTGSVTQALPYQQQVHFSSVETESQQQQRYQASTSTLPVFQPGYEYRPELDGGEDRESYEGYQVVRLKTKGAADRQVALELGQLMNLDIWAQHQDSIDILLPPGVASLFNTLNTLPSNTFITDVQSIIDATYPTQSYVPKSALSTSSTKKSRIGVPSDSTIDWPWKKRPKTPPPEQEPIPAPPEEKMPLTDLFHDSYHGMKEILDFIYDLSQAYPDMAESFTIGTSTEGRTIAGLRVGKRLHDSGKGDEDDDEEPEMYAHGGKKEKKGRKEVKKGKAGEENVDPPKEFIIQAGQHAREWISPSVALYFAHYLLTNAENDHIDSILNSFTFVIVPVVNVDGYEYTFKSSRLWRKTRKLVAGDSGCRGIDPNRNWGYEWSPLKSGSGELANPCGETYPGSFAFEADETRAVAEYLNSTTNPIAFIDVHSYGQLFMFPFSYSCDEYPVDTEDLFEAALGVTSAIRSVFDTEYETGQVCDMVFRAEGDAVDYSYGALDIKYSYSMELPDTGTYGFLLPPRLIRHTGEETTAGFIALSKFIQNHKTPY